MTAMQTVSLKCDYEGCDKKITLVATTVDEARLKANDARDWTTTRNALRTRDWCFDHAGGKTGAWLTDSIQDMIDVVKGTNRND